MPTSWSLPSAQVDLDLALADDRVLVLADLVALRQVGIEVVLAVEHRAQVDLRLQAQAGAHRLLDAAALITGSMPGMAASTRRDLVVGLGAEGRRARRRTAWRSRSPGHGPRGRGRSPSRRCGPGSAVDGVGHGRGCRHGRAVASALTGRQPSRPGRGAASRSCRPSSGAGDLVRRASRRRRLRVVGARRHAGEAGIVEVRAAATSLHRLVADAARVELALQDDAHPAHLGDDVRPWSPDGGVSSAEPARPARTLALVREAMPCRPAHAPAGRTGAAGRGPRVDPLLDALPAAARVRCCTGPGAAGSPARRSGRSRAARPCRSRPRNRRPAPAGRGARASACACSSKSARTVRPTIQRSSTRPTAISRPTCADAGQPEPRSHAPSPSDRRPSRQAASASP